MEQYQQWKRHQLIAPRVNWLWHCYYILGTLVKSFRNRRRHSVDQLNTEWSQLSHSSIVISALSAEIEQFEFGIKGKRLLCRFLHSVTRESKHKHCLSCTKLQTRAIFIIRSIIELYRHNRDSTVRSVTDINKLRQFRFLSNIVNLLRDFEL